MNKETPCETARLLMETNDPALAGHLLSCTSCITRTQAPYYKAPPGLEQKIRQSLRQEISTAPSPWRHSAWTWMAIAATVLLVASVTWNIALLKSHADPSGAWVSVRNMNSVEPFRSLARTTSSEHSG